MSRSPISRITQFFFDVGHYVRLVEEMAALGVDKPIVPGIMPVTNLRQIRRMAEMSGAEMPQWLINRLEICVEPPRSVGSASKPPRRCVPTCSGPVPRASTCTR